MARSTPVSHRHPQRALIWALTLGLACTPGSAAAQTTNGTTVTLRPHCIVGYAADIAALEEGGQQALEGGLCPNFAVEDPQTLQTPAYRVGDSIDVDIVVHNPKKLPVHRVRAWLSYDPNILRGDSVEPFDALETVTPGESGFSAERGYVMVEVSTENGNGIDDPLIPVARVQFTVLRTSPAGTVLSFYNVQPEGNTTIVGGQNGEEHLLDQEPGSLHIRFVTEQEPHLPAGSSCTRNDACQSGSCVNGICAPLRTAASSASISIPHPSSAAPAQGSSSPAGTLADGEACITSAQCASNQCVAGVCQPSNGAKIPDGGSCGLSTQCASGQCISNVCRSTAVSATSISAGSAGATAQDFAAASPPTGAGQTAFSLLQVRNLRITTEGTSVFLGWDPLESSQLKGYNIYYGTTTGRYIQRKTVERTTTSLSLRDLPEGTTYYVAVRAVNVNDEESAFSQEVAVTVGDPSTSTAPLLTGIPRGQSPRAHPVGSAITVPGETGVSSATALIVLISAASGTFFAFRRQIIAVPSSPA